MKKIYSFIAIFFVFLIGNNTIAQQIHYSIIPFQAGTVKLGSTKVIVNLDNETTELLKSQSLSAVYYVVFTPHDGASTPSISDKTDLSFSVTPNNSDKNKPDVIVDYVIFLKQKVIVMDSRKNASSMP